MSAGQRVPGRRKARFELPARAAAVAVAALLLAVLATACGERSEPTGPSASLYPITLTVQGSPFVVERPARRVAVVSTDVEGLVRALGATVVGKPVDPSGAIRLGELASLRPDLVVASASGASNAQITRAARAARARVYVVADDSVHSVERAITQLGLITDTSVEARRLVARIEAKRRLVEQRLRGTTPVRVFVDTGFFTPPPSTSLLGDLVREAHGTNLGGDTGTIGPVDLGELLRLDPSVYLATSDSGTTLAALRKNRRTRKLTAIRTGRFAIVDAALVLPGPRVGNGLLAIAQALHPDAFR